jgi:hypothetical protein
MKRFDKYTLRDTAVYWAKSAADGTGHFTFTNPIEIKCRWEQKQELFTGDDGQEHRSRAVVYPDRLLTLNSFLFKGTLDDLDSSGEMPEDKETWRIQGVEEISSLRGTFTVRKVWL